VSTTTLTISQPSAPSTLALVSNLSVESAVIIVYCQLGLAAVSAVSLVFVFDSLLTSVGNLQHLEPATAGDYGFELILAGYDTDGTPKIGKFKLSTHLSESGVFSPVIEEIHETTVGKELEHETAGIGGDPVEYILSNPGQVADELDIRRYAKLKLSDHGSSLTVADMEALAKSLARLSALFTSKTYAMRPLGYREWWPVGGVNQIAILEKGSLSKLDQPTSLFEARKLNMTPVSIVMGLTVDGGGVPGLVLWITQPPKISLILKSRLRGGLVDLDNAYFFEDDFSDATVYYGGGVLGFDPSNRISNCVLNIAEGVDRKSPAVQELIAKFPWKAVR
jgi:hypothetical protein